MDQITAAYIAGIIDGEGCLYIERFATDRSPIGFQYRTIVTVTMCDKATIAFIAKATGKNYRVRALKSGRIAYTIDWRNSIAAAFIREILPYLIGKREQAEWCLHFEDDVTPGRGRTYTKDDAITCEIVREKLKELKRHIPVAADCPIP